MFNDINESSLEDISFDKSMEWTETKSTTPKLKKLFMFSEWMVKVPDNLEDKWLFVLCPVGKRCLVRCSKVLLIFG